MKCFFIEVMNIPKEKLHPGLRTYQGYEEPDTYNLFLSTKGRLSNSPNKRANLESLDLAESFLEYWKPRLEKRDWGNFNCSIRQEIADKWRERQIPVSSTETVEFLNAHANSPIKKASKADKNLVILIDGVEFESIPLKQGYWSRHKKHGWIITSNIAHAQRYTSKAHCLNIIKKSLSPSSTKYRAKVHELTPEERSLIKDQKEEHWDSVFAGFNNNF